nr:MAG: hypothetical protein [Microvirus sp.]
MIINKLFRSKNRSNVRNEGGFSPSVTVPDLNISIKDMLIRHQKGLPTDLRTYYSNGLKVEDFDDYDPLTCDADIDILDVSFEKRRSDQIKSDVSSYLQSQKDVKGDTSVEVDVPTP